MSVSMRGRSSLPKPGVRRIVYNDDGDGMQLYAKQGQVKQDMVAMIDEQFATVPGIDTFAYCVSWAPVCTYRTKVGEILGNRLATDPSDFTGTYPRHYAASIKELQVQDTDVLEIVTDRIHHHGAEAIASIRISDTHHRYPDPENPFVPQALIDHPEWAIKRLDGIVEPAFDSSHPEVPAFRLAIIREIVENYDVDGVELDFVRWGKNFARHEAPFKVEIMDEFMGKVRTVLDEAAKKRGRERLALGALVPSSLYLCLLGGLDPRCWVRNGWMDYLAQCEYNCTNMQIPAAEFAEFCLDSNCDHLVRMGYMLGGAWNGKPQVTDRKVRHGTATGYRSMLVEPDEARATAANAYGFGADGIAYWNLCCHLRKIHDSSDEYRRRRRLITEWTREIVSAENAFADTRRYHFVPIYKNQSLPIRNYPVNDLRTGPLGSVAQIITFFPGCEGYRHIYRFLMADGRKGEELEGRLRCRILQSTLDDAFTLDLNGRPIDEARVRRDFVPDDELPAVWYEVDLAHCPAFVGDNELGITMIHQAAGSAHLEGEKFPYMEEIEVIVASSRSVERP